MFLLSFKILKFTISLIFIFKNILVIDNFNKSENLMKPIIIKGEYQKYIYIYSF